MFTYKNSHDWCCWSCDAKRNVSKLRRGLVLLYDHYYLLKSDSGDSGVVRGGAMSIVSVFTAFLYLWDEKLV